MHIYSPIAIGSYSVLASYCMNDIELKIMHVRLTRDFEHQQAYSSLLYGEHNYVYSYIAIQLAI